MVVHPFNTGTRIEKFGFHQSATWSYVISKHVADFDLTQEVTFNDRPNELCISQLTFQCGEGDAWELPNNVDLGSWSFNAWFHIYDNYGNHGQFKALFSDDKKLIEINNK